VRRLRDIGEARIRAGRSVDGHGRRHTRQRAVRDTGDNRVTVPHAAGMAIAAIALASAFTVVGLRLWRSEPTPTHRSFASTWFRRPRLS
jgi:hypothetical protein